MKLGISLGRPNINADTFKKCRNAGIDGIEISLGAKENADGFDFLAAKALADEYDLELHSFHLPFLPFNLIDVSAPAVAESSVEYLSALIEKATDVGIKTIVIHPSGEPIAEEDRPVRMATAKKSLCALADLASSLGATIAVEDLPRTCLGRNSDDILDLISAHPALRVCFDTNHLLNESIHDFIMKVEASTVTTHVSDYDAINERHWLAGEGVIDWKSLKNDLLSVGYDGYWLYELGLSKDSNTITRDRCLTYDDFRRNYDEIMADKPITTVGKGKKDLPMFP
ncbi:MAG: sugar phosphate isomerase/epimerase [Ruminococcaceae bacterium]|nr:sugar phosphate isomerase/epimerase [Oscillospiraceae bacterium]